jgi:hypothetical protein
MNGKQEFYTMTWSQTYPKLHESVEDTVANAVEKILAESSMKEANQVINMIKAKL